VAVAPAVTWAYDWAVEFGLLGPLEVMDGSEVCSLGGPKQRTVLVHLLLRANHEVTQEKLIDEVWGDDPPPTARGSLQSYVSRLRTALGPNRVEGHAGRYVLHAAPDELDASRFEALAREARGRAAGDPAAAALTYRTALGLWRGRVLEDLADEPSLRPEIARLEELRLAATEEWIAAELALGRHRELVATSRRWPAATRSTSGSGDSSWWPSTARAASGRRWTPTGACGRRSPTSSASTPRPSCGACESRSSARTPPSTSWGRPCAATG
jgi:hypothetical protein